MYMSASEGRASLNSPSPGLALVLAIAVAGTLLLGMAPGPLFDWALKAMLL